MKYWFVIIIFSLNCSVEKSTDLMQNIFVSAVKSAKVTVTGKVAKGKISQARVDAYRLNADGTCNTAAGNLASTVTDSSGDYTFTYLKTGAPICVIAVPNGRSKMYDEGTDTEIDWTGSTSLTMIVREPSVSSKTGMNLTPFSRIIASRLIEIAKNNRSTSILDKQVTYSNKVTAAMFGFTNGFGSSVRAETSVVDMDQMEDIFDSGINLNESSNSRSRYAMALLGAMSVAAGKTKQSTKLTSDDVEKYTAALAEDIADGTADGKNSRGESLSVNGTAVGTAPLAGSLMTALTEYVSSKPSLGVSTAEAAAISFNQAPVFLQAIPSETASASRITLTYPSLSYTLQINAPMSAIIPTVTGTVTNCTASPALPAGLSINTATCAITGTPTVSQFATAYNITASNPEGLANASISIFVLSNGSSWTSRTIPNAPGWNAVTYGNGLFVAVAGGPSTIAASSADGIYWTARTMPTNNDWKSVGYGNGVFVALCYNWSTAAASSTDGKNWTARTVPSMLNTGGPIAYGNGTFVQVSTGPTTIAVTSTDGITWTARTLPSNSMWSGTAFGNGIFVAIAGGSTAAASSTDGITWTARTLPSSVAWSKVAYGNGIFVAVAGGTTAAATSTDGITWTARTMPVSQNWLSIAYGNGVFVATANSSIAATSPDGINWTTRTMPSTGNFWVSTVYGNGIFVSAGGTAAASSP